MIILDKNLFDYSAIFIGGGNTFKLLKGIKDSCAFDKIKEELLEKQFSKEIKESTMINIKVATDLYNAYYYEIEK